MMSNFKQNNQEIQVFLSTDVKILSQTHGVILGIDYGMKRIGLALSDSERKIALPFIIIHKLKELDDIVPSKDVSAFVVGLPLQTDGQEGEIAQHARLFANRLVEKYNLPVLLIDERYTSKFASEFLASRNMREKKQKAVLDAHAAARILQKALDLL